MSFELHHTSISAFLVPNHTHVSIKLRDENQELENWLYRGFDDERLFILVTKKNRSRWIPISSISYVEQLSEEI